MSGGCWGRGREGIALGGPGAAFCLSFFFFLGLGRPRRSDHATGRGTAVDVPPSVCACALSLSLSGLRPLVSLLLVVLPFGLVRSTCIPPPCIALYRFFLQSGWEVYERRSSYPQDCKCAVVGKDADG